MSIDYNWFESEILNRSLSTEERGALDAITTIEQYNKGEPIVRQNQPGGELYVLRTGRAEIHTDANGERVHIAYADEGALFGEMTFLTGEPASADVTARADCTVYKLSRQGCSGLMGRYPELVFAMFAYMLIYSSKVIRHMNEEHIAMLHYITGRRV